jgi:hypothetical protein
MRGLRRLNAAFIGVLVVGLSLGPARAYTTTGGPAARTTQAAAERSDGPVDIAFAHVAAHVADLGVARADVADLAVASSYRSDESGVTHVNLTQRYRASKCSAPRRRSTWPKTARCCSSGTAW